MSLRLTRAQRAAFFSRDKSVAWPTLAGEGKAPVQAGYVHRLSSRLSIEITKVSHKRGKWSAEYKLHDDREEPLYLVPMQSSLERTARAPKDEHGQPIIGAPEEEIGYTRDPRRRRADYLCSVPPDVQSVIDMRARLDMAVGDAERAEEATKRQLRSLTSALKENAVLMARQGLDTTPMLAEIQRVMELYAEQTKDAA